MFLHPDAEAGDDIVNFIGYTLGLSLQGSGQLLHASLAMSNHHHTNTTDSTGDLPKFKNKFHAFVARGINAKRGRCDKFWTADAPCDVEQLTDEATLDDIVYTYTNPVEAGLVKWAKDWPGFSTYGWKFGERHHFRRPDWFYDPENPNAPDYVELELVRPQIFMDLSDEELWQLIQQKIRERERELQCAMAKAGRRFRGLAKIREQRWNRAAASPEERFAVTPQVSATSSAVRVARLEYKREWKRRYAEERRKLLAGEQPEFPYGTYWLRKFAGVRVAAAP